MRLTHGLRKHPLYSVWTNMKTRCYNKNNAKHAEYGGRGIGICGEWRADFETFYWFCIKNGWEPGLQIDRKDNNLGYTPSNCRFVSSRQNSINRRRVRKDNTSGYVGVYRKKGRGVYFANININQKLRHLGYFKTAIAAAKARDAFVIQNNLGYNLNFPCERYMKFHDIEQNTPEWHSLRLGKVTSSGIAKVMANDGKAFGDPAKQYAVKIALERLTGRQVGEHYTNAHMERGHEQEPIARALYEEKYFCDVTNGGFFDNGTTGDSPDGLIDDDGVLEIKCVLGHIQYETIRKGKVDSKYRWQVAFHLRESGRDWVDYVSYSSDFPEGNRLFEVRVYRDDIADDLIKIDNRLIEFEEVVQNCIKTIKSNAQPCATR